jgi:hypothetical protein
MLPSGAGGGGGRVSSDYVRLITKMIYDEPSVMGTISMLQSICLRQGILLHWGTTPPTPSFHAHIQRNFLPFCREAILSCLAVGFVPFRLRRESTNNNLVVPEVLPLGTYTWSVTRNEQRQSGSKNKKRKTEEAWSPSVHILANPPLLKYEVNCSYCEDEIHVFNYIQPQATLTCFSPLSGLIYQYNNLLSLRELSMRAEVWNARPNIVLEEQEKTFINDVTNTGACISHQVHQQFTAGIEQNSRMIRQETLMEMVESNKERLNIPQDSTVFVAPKNNTTKPLDKSEAPAELMKREMCFSRSVALALGIPGSFAGQGSQAGTSSSGGGWAESPEIYGRGMMEACLRLNRTLQDLLSFAYTLIYSEPASEKPRSIPTFSIPLAPNIPYELLLPLFDAQVLDDKAYSYLFEVSTGFPLGERAIAARDERHKAANIMPFRDKKEEDKPDPSSKKK